MGHYTALKLVPSWSSDLKNLRVNWIWYSIYKGKGCFSPKCVFSEMDHHTALKLVPLWSSDLKTSVCTEFGPLITKKSDVLSQKLYFFRSGSSYRFKTCTIAIGMAENLRVHSVWPSKYKEKWCFSPKSAFSETDHHTALKLVPLWSSHLKTSGCTEFGHLNTKKSDVLAQNVLFLETDHHTV